MKKRPISRPSIGPILIGATAVLSACDGDRGDFRDCSAVDISGAEALPDALSETGLYSDIAADTLSEDVVEFEPRFPLWTDGAKKRRFLLLPEGGQVDTSDIDDWVFPIGTRTFKQFDRDGVRIETRMNLKTEDGWAAVSYIWTDAGDDARKTLDTTEDASGTPHDVPGAAECQACHGGRRNFTLGFSAVQLDAETRETLHADGVLSDPVDETLDLPETAEAGLGYLHGNCSHCHNATREEQPQATECYTVRENFDLTLPAGLSSVARAPAVQTAEEHLWNGERSKVLDRMDRRDDDDERPSMPPLGTEEIDDAGVTTMRAFIESL